MSLVRVRDLRIETAIPGIDVVDGIDFEIEAGELVGVVGESGSGKTTVGNALLGFSRRGARIVGGEIVIDGVDLLTLDADALRALRGKVVSYVPQDPSASLNPAMRIRTQLMETLKAHDFQTDDRLEHVRETLRSVALPDDDEFLSRFPHQLSGGQQQRVTIAIALLCRPKVVVMDEPTTGLDVTTQAGLLKTVRQLCADYDIAGLYISHDLAVVSELVQRVLVMYGGRIAELGTRNEVFERPAHPYTRLLFATIPDVSQRRHLLPIPGQAPPPGRRPEGCFFAPRCPEALPECTAGPPPTLEVEPQHLARCVRAHEIVTRERTEIVVSEREAAAERRDTAVLEARDVVVSYGSCTVLHGVSVSLLPRECVALVGESGSGKTTLSRSIIGLVGRDRGEICFHGRLVPPTARERPTAMRKHIQYIFQSPFNSLNPRKTVQETLENPLRQFADLRPAQMREVIGEALESVALTRGVVDRLPGELSGGERQRVAIARALVCEPEVLICDEITSALDVSVQAAIVRLLEQLIEERGLSLLFVTHDLALVRTIADRVCVLKDGRLVESGQTDRVLESPAEPYTRELLADTPQVAWEDGVRSVAPGSGG